MVESLEAVRLRVWYGGRLEEDATTGLATYGHGRSVLETVDPRGGLAELQHRLNERLGGPVSLSYQIPGEALKGDSLVGLVDDSDLREMCYEFSRARKEVSAFARLQVYAFDALGDEFTAEELVFSAEELAADECLGPPAPRPGERGDGGAEPAPLSRGQSGQLSGRAGSTRDRQLNGRAGSIGERPLGGRTASIGSDRSLGGRRESHGEGSHGPAPSPPHRAGSGSERDAAHGGAWTEAWRDPAAEAAARGASSAPASAHSSQVATPLAYADPSGPQGQRARTRASAFSLASGPQAAGSRRTSLPSSTATSPFDVGSSGSPGDEVDRVLELFEAGFEAGAAHARRASAAGSSAAATAGSPRTGSGSARLHVAGSEPYLRRLSGAGSTAAGSGAPSRSASPAPFSAVPASSVPLSTLSTHADSAAPSRDQLAPSLLRSSPGRFAAPGAPSGAPRAAWEPGLPTPARGRPRKSADAIAALTADAFAILADGSRWSPESGKAWEPCESLDGDGGALPVWPGDPPSWPRDDLDGAVAPDAGDASPAAASARGAGAPPSRLCEGGEGGLRSGVDGALSPPQSPPSPAPFYSAEGATASRSGAAVFDPNGTNVFDPTLASREAGDSRGGAGTPLAASPQAFSSNVRLEPALPEDAKNLPSHISELGFATRSSDGARAAPGVGYPRELGGRGSLEPRGALDPRAGSPYGDDGSDGAAGFRSPDVAHGLPSDLGDADASLRSPPNPPGTPPFPPQLLARAQFDRGGWARGSSGDIAGAAGLGPGPSLPPRTPIEDATARLLASLDPASASALLHAAGAFGQGQGQGQGLAHGLDAAAALGQGQGFAQGQAPYLDPLGLYLPELESSLREEGAARERAMARFGLDPAPLVAGGGDGLAYAGAPAACDDGFGQFAAAALLSELEAAQARRQEQPAAAAGAYALGGLRPGGGDPDLPLLQSLRRQAPSHPPAPRGHAPLHLSPAIHAPPAPHNAVGLDPRAPPRRAAAPHAHALAHGHAPPQPFFHPSPHNRVVERRRALERAAVLSSAPRIPLGDVTFLGALGTGAFGEVALAETPSHGALAIKWVGAEAEEGRWQAFANEATCLAAVNHPNILRLYGIVVSDAGGSSAGLAGQALDPALAHLAHQPAPLGMALEVADGGSLAAILHGYRRAGARLPYRARLEVACQVALGLAHLHQAGFAHLDVKPENVLLSGGASGSDTESDKGAAAAAAAAVGSPAAALGAARGERAAAGDGPAGGSAGGSRASSSGGGAGGGGGAAGGAAPPPPPPPPQIPNPIRIKVADLGLARRIDRTTGLAVGVRRLMGTMPYIAPELARGDPPRVGAEADVYSLGVVLWEMAASRAPHAGRTHEEIAAGLRDGTLRLPALRGLEPEYEAALRACTSRNPDARPTAKQLARHLRAARQALAG